MKVQEKYIKSNTSKNDLDIIQGLCNLRKSAFAKVLVLPGQVITSLSPIFLFSKLGKIITETPSWSVMRIKCRLYAKYLARCPTRGRSSINIRYNLNMMLVMAIKYAANFYLLGK